MQKFWKAAESDDAKENLKKKLTEGVQFGFDAAKLINGTMTDDDWQNLYTIQEQSWSKEAVKKANIAHA
jgi:hypothetical protein